MANCPCGSNQPFSDCCGPYLAGKASPDNAEALMRSRYTAFTKADGDYLAKTVAAPAANGFNKSKTRNWAKSVQWKGLVILGTEQGGPNDDIGWVEFIASYCDDNGDGAIHERSEFKKINNRWYYTDGKHYS